MDLPLTPPHTPPHPLPTHPHTPSPHTPTPPHTHTDEGDTITYRIAVVADQDLNSKVKDTLWSSWLKTGRLTLHGDGTLSVKWDSQMTKLETRMAEKGRGAELSDLCVFNGKLYTVGDRTGIGWLIHSECVLVLLCLCTE